MSHEWTSNADSQMSRLKPPGRTCPTCHLNVDADMEKCPRDGTVLSDLSLAERLFEGRYEILSVIASGGMGTIYKAVQRALGKAVAIKMLKNQDNSHAMWARFKQEAKTASLLNHPNIIQVYDFGATSDGQPYMVMDYVDGTDLGALIKAEGKLKPFEAIRIFSQVCDAMYHAHTKGILHRDLKPSNLMLTNLTGVPEVKIVDFGIAKFLKGGDTQALTQTGEIFGSPYYMSPEQTTGKSVDHRSDIYSVGCIMYETLSGSVPISGNTAFETLMKHNAEKPVPIAERCPRANLSPELQKVVMKSLEKDAAKRFQTMDELKKALQEAPEAKSKTHGELHKTPRHSKKVIIIASVCGAIVLCGIAAAIMLWPENPDTVVEKQEVTLSKKTEERHQTETDFGKIEEAKPFAAAVQAPQPNAPKMQDAVTMTFLDNKALAKYIAENPGMTNIVLKDCTIDDDGAKLLDKLNLISASFEQCGRLKDKGFTQVVSTHPYLEILLINHASASSNLVRAIGKLRHLRELALNDVHGILGTDLPYLPMTLTNLSLESDTKIPTASLGQLARLTNLKFLSLANSLVSNNNLAELTKLKNIELLNLNYCPITDEGLEHVLKFKKLTRLYLRKTFISPVGFMKLAALPKLMELDVSDLTTKIQTEDYENFLASHNLCTIIPYMNKAAGMIQGTVNPVDEEPEHYHRGH